MNVIDISKATLTCPSYARPTVRVVGLQAENDSEYTEALVSDGEGKKVIGRIDYLLSYPCGDNMGGGVPCPVCLLKALDKFGATIHCDVFGHVLFPETPAPQFGNGDVPMLHWGYSGDVGKCYTCAGEPENEPVW